MSVEFVDKRGRDVTNFREALNVVEARLVRPNFQDPELFLQLLTIREALHVTIALFEKATQEPLS